MFTEYPIKAIYSILQDSGNTCYNTTIDSDCIDRRETIVEGKIDNIYIVFIITNSMDSCESQLMIHSLIRYLENDSFKRNRNQR
jgi:hypothetical protein